MSAVVDKLMRISSDRARRLSLLACSREQSEDALVERALDLLFAFWDDRDTANERFEWSALSETSLRRVWDNEADAVYDNWKELYDVPQG